MIAPKNIDRVLDALTVNQEELYYHILTISIIPPPRANCTIVELAMRMAGYLFHVSLRISCRQLRRLPSMG